MTRGIYYIATGKEQVELARDSAQSALRHVGNVPIAIATDLEVNEGLWDYTIDIDNPHYSFLDKPANITRTPFDQTIFLDADTYICGDIAELFGVLDRFEFAAAPASYRRIEIHPRPRPEIATDEIPDPYPEFNTGVMVFNTESMKSIFKKWEKIYRNHLNVAESVNDQPAFLEAIYQSDIRIGTLPPAYNCRVPFVGWVEQPVRVIHAKVENPQEIARDLNKFPNTGRIFTSYMVDDLMKIDITYENAAGITELPDNNRWSRWIAKSRLAYRKYGAVGLAKQALHKGLDL